MSDPLSQQSKSIRNNLALVLTACAISATVIGTAAIGGWSYLTDREDRLERREDKAEQRDSEARKLADEARAISLANEKERLALAQERIALEEQQRGLAERESIIKLQLAAIDAQRAEVGIDAQEKALREEARRLVAEYTALMGKPDLYRDSCAKQTAGDAGRPMLDRIRTIGEQLRNGGDLVDFAEVQGSGMWTTACVDRTSIAAPAASTAAKH